MAIKDVFLEYFVHLNFTIYLMPIPFDTHTYGKKMARVFIMNIPKETSMKYILYQECICI